MPERSFWQEVRSLLTRFWIQRRVGWAQASLRKFGEVPFGGYPFRTHEAITSL